MASPAEQQQAARNAAIVALAAQDLAPLWPQVDWESPDAVSAVQTVYRAIVTRYGRTAASAAALFYDQLRIALDLPTRYTAIAADPLPETVLNRTVESAFRGLRITELDDDDDHDHDAQTTSELPVEQRVQARLEQKLQKHVLQPGRDTIVANTEADPAKPLGWARVPTSDKPCGFCVMMASRTFRQHKNDPGLYSSEESATRVVGRGRGTARGTRQVGETYHNKCSCVARPIFSVADIPDTQADHREMYDKAAANAGTYADTKKILAAMRQLYDVR